MSAAPRVTAAGAGTGRLDPVRRTVRERGRG